jgi:hypothetical protein
MVFSVTGSGVLAPYHLEDTGNADVPKFFNGLSAVLSLFLLTFECMNLYTSGRKKALHEVNARPLFYGSRVVTFLVACACWCLNIKGGHKHTYLNLNAFAVCLIWFGGVHYLQMWRSVGPFFITVEAIIREDVIKWAAVLAVAFPSLSLAFSLLFQANLEGEGGNQELMDQFVPWSNAMYSQWLVMFGLMSWPRSEQTPSVVIIIVVFVLLLNILAVNLLIAMMNSTYERVQEESVPEWAFRQAVYVYQRSKWVSNGHCREDDNLFEFHGRFQDIFIQNVVDDDDITADGMKAMLANQQDSFKDIIAEALKPLATQIQKLSEVERRLASIEDHLGIQRKSSCLQGPQQGPNSMRKEPISS